MLKDIIYLRIGNTCYGELGIFRQLRQNLLHAMSLKLDKDVMDTFFENENAKTLKKFTGLIRKPK